MMFSNLIQFFLTTTAQSPNTVAIRDGKVSVSFGELKANETKIADWLSTTYKTTRQPVAIFLPKCAHAIMADLAIVHSGNAYMNMDVKTPTERLAKVLKQAQPLCITTAMRAPAVPLPLPIRFPKLRLIVPNRALPTR